MQRHVNDPYVKRAIKEGYRARSAYKLLEIHEKSGILKPGIRAIDLGSAPGGWSQVLSKKISSGKIISLDLLDMNPITNCQFLKMDIRNEKTIAKIVEICPEGVQLIVSDLSPNHSGNTDLDCLEIIDLNNLVIDLSKKVMLNGGNVIMKMLMGEFEHDHFNSIKKHFEKAIRVKPNASRKESKEIYYCGLGWKKEIVIKPFS